LAIFGSKLDGLGHSGEAFNRKERKERRDQKAGKKPFPFLPSSRRVMAVLSTGLSKNLCGLCVL
jgi:hypothetical protein